MADAGVETIVFGGYDVFGQKAGRTQPRTDGAGLNRATGAWRTIAAGPRLESPAGGAIEIPLVAMIHPQNTGRTFKDVKNAHVIIEQAAPDEEPVGGEVPGTVPWPVSAKSGDALDAQIERLRALHLPPAGAGGAPGEGVWGWTYVPILVVRSSRGRSAAVATAASEWSGRTAMRPGPR